MSPAAKPLHHDTVLNLFRLISGAVDVNRFKVGMSINFRMPERNSMPSPDVWVIEVETWERALQNDAYPQGGRSLRSR